MAPVACPNCQSSATSRSRRKGFREAVLLRLIGRAPFRCGGCRQRFFARYEGRSMVAPEVVALLALGAGLLLVLLLVLAVFSALGLDETFLDFVEWLGPATDRR